MKKFIVDTNNKKKYSVEANDAEHAVELVKKIDNEASQLQINDAGWFDLTTIELQDSSELTLTKLVKDVKNAVRRTVAEITNGRFDAGILRLQVLVKDNMSNKFNWMELPISYRLSYDVLLKLHTESEYKAKKALSELNAKLKQFAGKQLYKDKSIVSDSFIVIDDEASQLQTVNALIEDENAAVAAYNVAIENLRGKIPEDSLQVIITTRDDENRHIENLQAVINGTVTEKNLEDSMMNDAAVNCNKFEILAKESGANFHNISSTKKDGVTYMKFVSSAPEAEQERAVNWLRSVLEGQEGSGVLSWGMRGTSRGEMAVMIKDSMIHDTISGCYEALEKAKDAISAIYKNYAKEQDEEYMLKKLNEASSAIARAIRQYKAWI